MSNKVITFLVVLFAVTGLIIYVAKTTSVVKTDAPQAQEKTSEAAVTPAPAAADKPAETTAGTETPAAAAEPAKTEETEHSADNVLSDDAPLSGDHEAVEAAKAEDTAEKKAPASLTPESFPALPATPTTGGSTVTGSEGGSSLLAPSAAMDIDMDNALAERALGDVDAPVTVIEYASMTCPHCARFHNDILPVVKQRLIDTGKLRLIFRDYPLDTHALKAAMMARCTDRSRYFQLVEVIFKQQSNWIKGTDPLVGLKQLGALAGMEPAFIDTCVANPQLQQFLLSGMQEGQQKYKIKATPTFVFNNGAEQMEGDKNPEDFDAIVEKLLKKKGN